MSQPLSIPAADLSAARLRALVEAAPAAAVVLAGDWLYPNPAARTLLAQLDIDTGCAPLAAAQPAAAALAAAVYAALQAGGRGELLLAGQRFTLAASAAGERLQLAWLTPAAQDAWRVQERQHLQALHERLRLAGEVGQLGLFERDLDTGAAYWDPTCYALFERDPALGPPQPPTGTDIDTLIDERDRTGLRAHYEQLQHAPLGTAFAVEYRVLLAGGRSRHLEVRGRVQADAGGRGRRLVGVMIDVSAMRAAEAERRELADRLALAASAARLGLWEIDLRSGRNYWNEQMFQLSGLPPHHGTPSLAAWLPLVHEDDRERLTAVAGRLHADGGSFDEECRLRRPDGRVVWLRTHGVGLRGSDGRVVRLIGAQTDITAEREAAAERERLLQRLQLATATGGVGIWEQDVDSGRELWDDSLCRILGCGPGPQMRSAADFAALLHPDDARRVGDQFAAALAGRASRGGPLLLRVQPSGGPARDLVANFVIERDADGRARRVVGTTLDVTDLRAAEQRQRAANRKLEAAVGAARLGVAELDLRERVAQFDARQAEIYGLGAPLRIGFDDWLILLHPADREAALAHFNDIVRPPREGRLDYQPDYRLDYRIVLPGGTVRDLTTRLAVERGADGAALSVVAATLDITDLRAAERAARRAAERLEVATAAGGVGVYERDADDRMVYADGVVLDLYGRAAGAPWPQLDDILAQIAPEDRERYLAARRRMKESDAPVRCEYRTRVQPGGWRDVLTWRRRRSDASGRYLGEIGAVIDVTELRSAERRATELATRLSFAQAGAGMGVWEWNPVTDETYWDEQIYRLLDEPPGPTDQALFMQRVHPDDRARLQATLARSLQDGGPFDEEFRIVTRSGQVRTLCGRGEAFLDTAGRPFRVVGINWDITARREAERAAREATARLQLAASASGIGCWEFELASEQATWDDATYALYGASAADGAPAALRRRCVLAEDRATLQAALAAAVTGDGNYEAQYRIRRLDGAVRWLAARGTLRLDAGGRPARLVGVSWDITEARRAEAALRAKETAERANQAKSEFLARMSHELRTPMNAIIGFTQLLELDPDDPLSATQRERVGLIRNAGWHLLNLVNDVLDLARIESGRASVQMEVVAWAEVVAEAVGMVQPDAAARGIAIQTLSVPGTPTTLWADRTRLRQVLLNLLSNAVKYNRERGNVSVTAGADGGAVVIAVRDTGRGLAPAQQARLFQPFERLGMDATGLAGTGIGLAIAQRLAQQMDGTLEVDSEPDVGSEFRLRLRASRVEPPRATPPPPAPALASDESVEGIVLYVEDNATNSALVEQLLQFRPRVRLFRAADGATGLVMAAISRPDLILIDMRLPDMTGDEVLAQLRADAATAHINAVAVSANALEHDIARALAGGFAEYWPKPLDATHFLAGIDHHLRAARARAGSAGMGVA